MLKAAIMTATCLPEN